MKLVNVCSEQIIELSKSKEIICFGSGRKFTKFCDVFSDKAIIDYIDCVIDNNPDKWGTNLEYNGRFINIISPDTLAWKNNKDIFLIVTCADIFAICKQLCGIDYFNNISFGIADFIIYKSIEDYEKSRFYPSNYRITESQIIPKIIHYCWFGGKTIPDKNKHWMKSWKKYCPDYEIVEWNESNYDYKKNEFMYEAYKAKKWGFVPDYARLDIVYNYGGIYLDTDVEIIRSFDELLYQEAFAGVDSSHLVSFGLGFGAVKKNKIFPDLLSLYKDRHFDINNMIPAPTLEKVVHRNKGFIEDGNYQIVDGLTIYPEKVLSAKNYRTGLISPTSQSFSIHHYDASWLEGVHTEQNNFKQVLFSTLISSEGTIEINDIVSLYC